MTYSGEAMPMIFTFKTTEPAAADGDKNVMFFRHADGPGATSDYAVRFSDYRSVNGIQLPYHWSTTGGDMQEELDVTSYEFNPADISSSFEKQKVGFSVKKDGK